MHARINASEMCKRGCSPAALVCHECVWTHFTISFAPKIVWYRKAAKVRLPSVAAPLSPFPSSGLAIGASTVNIVRFFMVALFPVAKPVALALDWVLGEELRTVFDKEAREPPPSYVL